jgi:hypothetical protein
MKIGEDENISNQRNGLRKWFGKLRVKRLSLWMIHALPSSRKSPGPSKKEKKKKDKEIYYPIHSLRDATSES